ncbi:putative rho/rac-interacting citron kinase [Operophtera brumata]|uniref:Putative rho/rac-interacting citron kinase n=1 Tax=Operophtera brumata TaxID=104452 RepID=A0A0L7LTD0_OPEBR|nr:putative rho/rac-interacting citron kinase [Operophtera brumata]
MHARCADGALMLRSGERELRAALVDGAARNLPQNEANRAFTIKLESPDKGSVAAIVCSNLSERASWLSKLQAAPAAVSLRYGPATISQLEARPCSALYVAPNAVAIVCSNLSEHASWLSKLQVAPAAVSLCYGPATMSQLEARPCSALYVAPNAVAIAVACGRRVFILRFDATVSEFKTSRSLTVDRPPHSLLLTTRCLYIAGEKPLKINLPSGALETFASDVTTVAAATKQHSPPKAILLIREKPVEILLCYIECGVFVDEYGKRTRNEDPKWSSTIHSWEFVAPFLYIIGEDKVTIIYLNDEAYKSPPCTCDNHSVASSLSECYMPEVFELKVNEPSLLGTAPKGIIIQTKDDECYNVCIVEGMAAFRSIGASVESLDTVVSDAKGSSVDLAQSQTDLSSPHEVSQESVEATTGFLADIRTRARQLRAKNRQDQSDDMIKQILTTEVGIKRLSVSRKSPVTTSEFDSDSTGSEGKTASSKGTNDLCAEMFTRQVRFQQN